MTTSHYTRLVSAATAGALVLPLASCAALGLTGDESASTPSAPAKVVVTGEFRGAGASSQESAMEAWITGFQELHPEATVSYDPIGSGDGRERFLAGKSAFGASDVALSDEEMAASGPACDSGNAIDLPVYISPIAVAFNLKGIDQLNLSSDVIARIFTGHVTQWNDPAIVAANPGVKLPALEITPVHRSDDSGTTENFTDYLGATAPKAWPYPADGLWPLPTGFAAEGTGGVTDTVRSTPGGVTYADASRTADLGRVAIKVGDEYVPYSADAAAAVVDLSPRIENRYEHDLAFVLDRTIDKPFAYPMVLVSYLVVCSRYADKAEGAFVKEFVEYVASDEGQRRAADAAGSAVISPDLQDWIGEAGEAIYLTMDRPSEQPAG
ncbi:phosphate ABC transporter substrate-binding protein PstS [Promicromonospora sukumoe]|uniref:Phosphate-binding protein n=1 Tax=Promicromonospora sukumoe TaxID=88382 RepID=A0A7W3JCP3_9MICO|nr:phosphate ABC transporter substrate-binding protein PstS [Promicromonospora sukumoe]MBA8810400.1 phosphate transport system substrate-binding protein [Promicromonospora sukumoe]